MTLPAGLREWIEGEHGPILSIRAVGGGCIHPSARIEIRDGLLFAKWGGPSTSTLFSVEAAGLQLLRSGAEKLRVPRALGTSEEHDPEGWLVLEWLEPVGRPRDFGERLGGGLATMHRQRGTRWGWDRDGFIGSLPQVNTPGPGWSDFWWNRRLEPQLRMAKSAGQQPGTGSEWDRLAAMLPDLLQVGDQEGPSLLHGDLWGGNILCTAPGDPALVDPAVYYGHREVDLAMSELFGGFDPSFYAAYDEVYPRAPGYSARRDVYQLYYLLVHVNLFGGGYVGQTAAALRRVIG